MVPPPDRIDIQDDPHYLKLALDACGVGVWSFIDGFVQWDARTRALFGTDQAPKDLPEYLELIHHEDRAPISLRIEEFIATGVYRDIEHRIARVEGRWLLCKGMAVKDGSQRIRGLMGLTLDITERKSAEQRLLLLSSTDELTDLPNRRECHASLEREWRRCARQRTTLALVAIDIDHFKDYNDAYGHVAGDRCLRQVAKALRSCTRRPADVVARVGGEEFLAILPETDLGGAADVARRMSEAVRALALDAPTAAAVTVSCGVSACVPDQGRTFESLVLRADEALYEAKGDGRACVRSRPPA